MPGTKKLDIVKTSRSFVWTGAEVLSNAGQGALYILTEIPLLVEVSSIQPDSIYILRVNVNFV